MQLVRRWTLLQFLHEDWWSVLELAEELEVSKATVQRDINELREVVEVRESDSPDHSQMRLYHIRKSDLRRSLGF